VKKQQVRPDHGFLPQLVNAAIAAPVALGLTALGAMVTVTQWVLASVVDLLPELPSVRPRHNAKRVREQVIAAKRVAEASGVLKPKVPDRSGRDS
jgi:threonine/homoserine/homoserine lactone efflux protein